MQNIRHVSVITVKLSLDPLDKDHMGYQPPLPPSQKLDGASFGGILAPDAGHGTGNGGGSNTGKVYCKKAAAPLSSHNGSYGETTVSKQQGMQERQQPAFGAGNRAQQYRTTAPAAAAATSQAVLSLRASLHAQQQQRQQIQHMFSQPALQPAQQMAPAPVPLTAQMPMQPLYEQHWPHHMLAPMVPAAIVSMYDVPQLLGTI